MPLLPITYKRRYDEKGDFDGIELWQGDQHITMSLALPGLHYSGYKWDEVKKVVDAAGGRLQDEMMAAIRAEAIRLRGQMEADDSDKI